MKMTKPGIKLCSTPFLFKISQTPAPPQSLLKANKGTNMMRSLDPTEFSFNNIDKIYSQNISRPKPQATPKPFINARGSLAQSHRYLPKLLNR